MFGVELFVKKEKAMWLNLVWHKGIGPINNPTPRLLSKKTSSSAFYKPMGAAGE